MIMNMRLLVEFIFLTKKMANNFLPPLLKFYLRLGGKVSDHAVIDKDLDTLHVFTYLDLNSKKNN